MDGALVGIGSQRSILKGVHQEASVILNCTGLRIVWELY
jgi:hypothetical protein